MVIINWSPGKGEGKGKPCAFTIATTGSTLAPMVDLLRNIRDNGLRISRVGTLFVNSYEWIYFLTGIFKIISKISQKTMKLINA